MSKTVVGLFGTIAQAQEVQKVLVSDGFDPGDVSIVANQQEGSTSTETTSTTSGDGVGMGQKINDFFHSLTGGDEDAHHHYATGVNQGGGLLAVTVEDDEAAEIADLLKQHGAHDIDKSYDESAKSGVPVYSEGTSNGQTAIPIVEEELVVGKREVERGGVRVYSHVVSEPVSTDVTLRDEYINVERRPVNRVATAADFAAGQGSVVELTAMGEEAVVGKTSRVVEEVLVGKSATTRTEAIEDTVRHTEVDVEELPVATVTSGTDRY